MSTDPRPAVNIKRINTANVRKLGTKPRLRVIVRGN